MRTRAPYELFRVDGSPYYYVYFLDRNGNRIRKSTRETVKDRAHAVARELERRFADPTYQASNATTIAVASGNLRAYLQQKGRSAETVRFYEQKCSHVARVFGADSSLADITAKSTDDYILTRYREGAHRHTVAKELTALRMLLKVARRRGEYDREVSQVLPVGFATGYKPRTRRLTPGEAWALITELPAACARYAAFVCATTARDSAAKRATGRDLVAVGIRVHDHKTAASYRIVPLTRVTLPFATFAFQGIVADAAVSPGVSSVRHAFDRACGRLGFPHTSPNDLRRSVAHWHLEAGVPRDLVAALMGHTSTKMLDLVYGKLDGQQIGAAIARALPPLEPSTPASA